MKGKLSIYDGPYAWIQEREVVLRRETEKETDSQTDRDRDRESQSQRDEGGRWRTRGEEKG